jgi:hypothetical protein
VVELARKLRRPTRSGRQRSLREISAELAAQRSKVMRRIGLLTGAFGPDSQARVAVFLQAMALLGWTEGQNVQFEICQGGGNFDTIRKHAGELARLNKRFFYALFSVIRLLGAGRPMSRSVYVFFPLLTIVGALCGPAFGQRAYSNVSTGIFGEKDQRVRISSDRWPWVAIGRINVIAGTGPQLCTGTVIGSRRVLTAAQCLFDALINNWVKPSSVHFVVGQEKDKNLGHSVVESFVKSPDFAYRLEERPRWDAIDPKMIRRNWAILSLRDELPVKTNPASDNHQFGIERRISW